MTFVIKQTWDGTEIPLNDTVHIDINFHAHDSQKNAVASVSIRSPFYNNPIPNQPIGSLWQLWEHEVVEVFLVGADGCYLEMEFGPYGHFLVLQLNAPRNITNKHLPIQYTANIEKDRWFGKAFIPTNYLPNPIEIINCFAILKKLTSTRV